MKHRLLHSFSAYPTQKMVSPTNIQITTDTKWFNNAKPDLRSAKIKLKRNVQPVACKKLSSGSILVLVAIVAVCIFLTVLFTNKSSSVPWYKTATLYQVDIKTFQDSDRDGIGDLKGLISKVKYLERQNIKALMLSSFYESENDGVLNHKEVSYTHGTMEDFRELVKLLKERGIRLIIDFNPNHTSDKHPWFQASIKGLKNYDDYYIWSDSILDDKKRPPNNWLNVNKKSAWIWNEERKQFYLSTFGRHLPDLNLRNALVRNELKDILMHWLKEDVDGFNVVAASHLVENAYLFNEPVLMLNKAKKLQYSIVDHVFTRDQYENLELFSEWKQILNSFSTKKILIAQASGSSFKSKMYYGNETFPLATLVYSTQFSKINENVTGTELRWHFESWTSDVPSYGWPAWMIRCKTEPRLESRIGYLLDGLNMIIMIAKGTPITYSGDEFGLSSFQYEDSVQISMEGEFHLNIFRKLLSLRADYALIHGVQQYPIVTDKVFSLLRCYATKGYLAVVNLGNEPVTLDFTSTSSQLPSEVTLMFQSGNFANSSLNNKEQQKVLLNNLELEATHSALFSFGPSLNIHNKRKRLKI